MDTNTRNKIMPEYIKAVKWTIKQNLTLFKALRLDLDDVYQDLCIAVIKAIDVYDPQKSPSLFTHVNSRLRYAVLQIKRKSKHHGMTAVGKAEIVFASLDYRPHRCAQIEIPAEEPYSIVELTDAICSLARDEQSAVKEVIKGFHPRKKKDKEALASAQEKIKKYYERSNNLCY